MENRPSLFNRAARAAGRSIAESFASAALSRPGQFFINNAGIITSASNITANILLGFRFPWASAAFMAQEPGWMLNNLNERLRRGEKTLIARGNIFQSDTETEIQIPPVIARLAPYGKTWAGGASLLGIGLFLGFSDHAHDPGMGFLVVSNLPGMGQSLSAIFENQAHQLSHWLAARRSPIWKAVATPLSFAMVSTTLLEFGFGSGLFTVTEAFGDHAKLMVPIGLCLMTGDLGIFCQDKSLLAALEARKAERAARITPENFLTYARRGAVEPSA